VTVTTRRRHHKQRVALTLIGTDEAQLRKIYDDLSARALGTTLERVFWGDIFGALTAKFGINWQVNIALP
jgi:PhnB protein